MRKSPYAVPSLSRMLFGAPATENANIVDPTASMQTLPQSTNLKVPKKPFWHDTLPYKQKKVFGHWLPLYPTWWTSLHSIWVKCSHNNTFIHFCNHLNTILGISKSSNRVSDLDITWSRFPSAFWIRYYSSSNSTEILLHRTQNVDIIILMKRTYTAFRRPWRDVFIRLYVIFPALDSSRVFWESAAWPWWADECFTVLKMMTIIARCWSKPLYSVLHTFWRLFLKLRLLSPGSSLKRMKLQIEVFIYAARLQQLLLFFLKYCLT